MSKILYQDNQVTIYPECILIRKYYFPLGTSKTILMKDIERISIIDIQGATHRWGISTTYLNNWFPLDNDRKNKKKFIEIHLIGRNVKPSITPQDPQKVVEVIYQLFYPKTQTKDETNPQQLEQKFENSQITITNSKEEKSIELKQIAEE